MRGTRGKAFVDFQNDVTDDDVALAEHEGFRAVEHLKRYTTLGMATDQGKTSNLTGLALMAELTAKSIPQTGTTTFRPPFAPVAIGALAGQHRGKEFRPTRLPPSHRWAQEQGAVFVETGYWLRAQWYPRPGETDWLESVNREVRTVREQRRRLRRLHARQDRPARARRRRVPRPPLHQQLEQPRRRPGALRPDAARGRLRAGRRHHLAPRPSDRFVVTTTTANAAKVLQHMEFCHQWLWPELDVQFSSVSEQWAQFSVAGPRSRDVLRSDRRSASTTSPTRRFPTWRRPS